MKQAELQKKTDEELLKIMAAERVKLQQLRFDLSGGKVKNIREIRQIRRSIARILTLLTRRKKKL